MTTETATLTDATPPGGPAPAAPKGPGGFFDALRTPQQDASPRTSGRHPSRDPNTPAWVPEQYKTGEDFAKAHHELIGRMHEVGLRPKDSSEYEWKPQPGFESIQLDPESSGRFKEFAHEIGLSKKQYSALLDFYGQSMDGLTQDLVTLSADRAEAMLRQAWPNPADFQGHLRAGFKVLTTFLEPSDLAEFEAINHPAVWKLLARIGAELPEDSGLANVTGAPELFSEAEHLMKEGPEGAYQNPRHPGHAMAVAKVTEAFARGWRGVR